MSYRFSRVSFLRAVLIFVVVLLSSLQKERQFVTADVRLRHGEHIKVLARVENPDLKYVRVDDIDEEYLNETMKRDDDDVQTWLLEKAPSAKKNSTKTLSGMVFGWTSRSLDVQTCGRPVPTSRRPKARLVTDLVA